MLVMLSTGEPVLPFLSKWFSNISSFKSMLFNFNQVITKSRLGLSSNLLSFYILNVNIINLTSFPNV